MAVYGIECCPYLSLKGDESSYRTYPAPDAVCLALSGSHSPSEDKQHLLCHSRQHLQCPRYAQARTSPSARRRLPFHRRPHAILVSLLLAALTLAAFGFRILQIGDFSLSWDETLSYHRASAGLLYALSNRIMLGTSNTIDTHPPLYFVLLSAVIAVAGKSEFVLRFASVASTVLAVPVAYITGTRLVGRTVGIAAATLWASSPFLLWKAWEARPYGLLALLSALSVYLLLRTLEADSPLRWVTAWLLCLGAMAATHYLAAILVACELIFALGHVIVRRAARWRVLAGGTVVLAGLAVPTTTFVLQRFQVVRSPFAPISASDYAWDLLRAFSLGQAGGPLPISLLMPLIGVVLLSGIAGVLRKEQRRATLVVLFTLAMPSLGLYLVTWAGPLLYNTRYSTFLAPGYFLLLALGIANLLKLRRAAGVGALLCVAGVAVAGMLHSQSTGTVDQQDLRAISAHIIQEARDGDAVVLTSLRPTTALQYYPVGSLDQVILSAAVTGASPRAVASQLESIAKDHPRLWILTDYWLHDRDQDLLNVLDASYSRLKKVTFTYPSSAHDLYLYQTTPRTVEKLPEGATPVQATLGDTVRLIGYTMEPSTSNSGRIYLTLYWQVLATPQRLRVFGDLTDSQGRIWGSFDGEPFGGFFPTTTWKQGDIVVDEREIDPEPGAPPGRYSLSVGMRSFESSQAIPVVTPGRLPRESMPLGDVELKGFDQANRGNFPPDVTRLDANVGPLVLLAAKNPIADVYPGETLPLRLYWRLSSVAWPVELINVRLTLLTPDGEIISSTMQSLADRLSGDESVEGALLANDYALPIPREATSRPYRVAISVGRRDEGYWRFGPSWWIFAPDRITLTTVRVHAFDRQTDVPSASLSINKDVGGTGELAAFAAGTDWRAQRDSAGVFVLSPQAARPSSIEVTLYWRAQAQTDRRLTAFVQLLDADGRLALQHDSVPQLGTRPTTSWLPPEVIADPHPLLGLEALPSGQYTLIAGLYDATTGQRLQVGADDHIVLGKVTLP